jgi:hypothetical protein
LPDSKTVYFQFNVVTGHSTETFSDFVNRLFTFIDEQKIEKLIIDLRWNNGGNTKLLPPLIQNLIRCDPINREGHLFVITGRYTYSAGMNAATLMERNADAIFVGEPTPSSPKLCGGVEYRDASVQSREREHFRPSTGRAPGQRIGALGSPRFSILRQRSKPIERKRDPRDGSDSRLWREGFTRLEAAAEGKR